MSKLYKNLGAFVIYVLSMLTMRVKSQKDIKNMLSKSLKWNFKLHYMLGYFKTVVGFFQVTAKFLVNFGIQWPDLMVTVMSLMNFFNLDLFNFPSIACIFSELTYVEKHQIYTLVPICIICLLMVPALLVKTHPLWKKEEIGKEVVDKVVSAFFFWVLSFLFVIYPATSSTVLNTFNCLDLGNYGSWLKADMRVECPSNSKNFGYAFSSSPDC